MVPPLWVIPFSVGLRTTSELVGEPVLTRAWPAPAQPWVSAAVGDTSCWWMVEHATSR